MVMSFKEFSKIKKTKKYEHYIVKSKNKEILVLGAEHSRNPNHSQFNQFAKLLKRFKPEIIFYEAFNKYEPQSSSLEKEVSRVGEKGLCCLFKNIESYPWDTPFGEIAKKLLRKFSKEEIFLAFAVRFIPYYHNIKVEEDFSKYLKRIITKFKKETKWKNFAYSIKNIEKIHQKILHKKFNPKNKEDYNWVSPTKYKNKLNSIFREMSYIRNRNMLEIIRKTLKNHDKVALIMGHSHAVMQKPYLKII